MEIFTDKWITFFLRSSSNSPLSSLHNPLCCVDLCLPLEYTFQVLGFFLGTRRAQRPKPKKLTRRRSFYPHHEFLLIDFFTLLYTPKLILFAEINPSVISQNLSLLIFSSIFTLIYQKYNENKI